MKLLILNDDFPPEARGGAGVVAFRIGRELHRMGHSVAVIARTAGQAREEMVAGMQVYRLRSSYPERFSAYMGLYNPQVVSPLKHILKKIMPDIVHAHNIHTHLSYHSLKVARDLGIPVFLTAHDVMSFSYGKLTSCIDQNDLAVPASFNYHLDPFVSLKESRLRYFPPRNFFIRRYLRYSVRRIVSVSDALRQALEANGIDNVEVIHNGIEPDALQVDEMCVDAYRQRMGLAGKKVILFCGRINTLKGLWHILSAMQLVRARVPEAVLLIAGEWKSYEKRIPELIAEFGLQGGVALSQWIDGDDLRCAYAASTVVAVPSTCFDSFPTANLEAMAAAKPVIATCFGGSPEVVANGETGFIVNPLNTAMLAARLAEFLESETLARRMGEAGNRRLREHFSIEQCALRYLGLFGRYVRQAANA